MDPEMRHIPVRYRRFSASSALERTSSAAPMAGGPCRPASKGSGFRPVAFRMNPACSGLRMPSNTIASAWATRRSRSRSLRSERRSDRAAGAGGGSASRSRSSQALMMSRVSTSTRPARSICSGERRSFRLLFGSASAVNSAETLAAPTFAASPLSIATIAGVRCEADSGTGTSCACAVNPRDTPASTAILERARMTFESSLTARNPLRAKE